MAATKQLLKYSLVFALGLAGALFAVESPEIITLRTKAVRGNAIAQYNLGRIFADARSANLDRAEAFVWFQIAADNGTTGRELARLVEVMTPQELAEGKSRLQERRAQLASSHDAAAPKAEPASPASGVVPDEAAAKLATERDQLISSLNAATAELAALRANAAKSATPALDDAARLNNELNEARIAAREYAAKNAQLEDIASERSRELQASQVELAKLKSETAAAPVAPSQDSQLTAVVAERDLLLKQLSDAQAQARKTAERPDRLARAERDANLLRDQNAKQAAALREAEAQLKATNGGKGAAAERDAQLAQAQNDIDDLNKKNLELADRAQRGYAAEQELAIARDKIAAEQKRVEELTASAAQQALANEKLRHDAGTKVSAEDTRSLRDQIAALQKQNAELVERAAAAETKLAATPPPIAAPVETQTASEAGALQKQLEETNEKLTTALRSYSLLQKELDQARAASSQTSAEAEAKLVTAESEIAALRSQLAATTGESQERASSLSGLQREMEQQRHTMITQGQETLSLRDQLRQTLSQVAVLADENSQLRTRLAVLAPPPSSSMANPMRPGTAAAQAAITLPPALAKSAVAASASEPRQHIVGDGDTLSKISRKYYGTPDRWNEIYDANRGILRDPSRLPKGAALRIP
ncbi:MAG: hypothetical protein WC378_10075 [Opitutaceae bacterium]|jgi:nucleoid-associated protein YgaU